MKHISSLSMLGAALFFLSACGSPSLPSQSAFDNAPLATPCVIASDSISVILRDYFPKLSKMDTVTIKADSAMHLISLFDVHEGEQTGELIVFNRTGFKQAGLDGSRVPLLTTRSIEGTKDKFNLVIANGQSDVAVLWQNTLMGKKFFKKLSGTEVQVTVPANAKRFKRSYIRVYAANEHGIGNDVLVPLDYGEVVSDISELDRTDKRAQIMYFLMIDRFKDGDTSNTRKLNVPNVLPKVDYFGGDIAGMDQVLKSGYFDSLGIHTIWISPVTQNPYDAWGQ
ncbi:MAG: hypothetical protein QMB59_06095, partial [Bacteroidales bacterium]